MKGLRRVFGGIYFMLVWFIYFNLWWVYIFIIYRIIGVNKKLKFLDNIWLLIYIFMLFWYIYFNFKILYMGMYFFEKLIIYW